jgi:uncharacterized Zn finger protein
MAPFPYSDDYVSVAARRRDAERRLARLVAEGREVAAVVIDGRDIATTFWGKAWCANLERYSDYANRLPRGRSYVRGGAVVDLQIASGRVTALVSGKDLYDVRVEIAPVPPERWREICRDCGGAIDSLVELLRGRLSEPVMERLCRERTGLFPMPHEIRFTCSCPDWASMCKHVAATLYGVGARLDARPELLFVLRNVHAGELIATADAGLVSTAAPPKSSRLLDGTDLSKLFGIEIGRDVPRGSRGPREPRGKGAARTPEAAARRPKAPAGKPKATAPPRKPSRRRAGSSSRGPR